MTTRSMIKTKSSNIISTMKGKKVRMVASQKRIGVRPMIMVLTINKMTKNINIEISLIKFHVLN